MENRCHISYENNVTLFLTKCETSHYEMNTVEIGDNFELRAYELIKKAINDDELGISPKYSRVFQKKGYTSHLRDKEIIFDLSIEIWPPNSERFSILYLIECKNYSSKNVPVDDVEEFLYKLTQIANLGFFVKGAIVSNGSFQQGAIEIAKRTGLMLVEVGSENTFSIKLHKTQISTENSILENSEIDKDLETFIYNVFNLSQVQGLRKLSKDFISNTANSILNEIDITILEYAKQIPLNRIVEYFKEKFSLKFDFENSLGILNNKKLLGRFDVKNNCIEIDKALIDTERFSFLLAHEIGHFIMHRNLMINQHVYDNFQDSEYDFLADKYLLNNYKNWIEWQANYFASALILPNKSLTHQLIEIQKHLGISKYGHIYLDDQPINRQDFAEITKYLSTFFNTTKTSIIYRLEGLGLLTYTKPKNEFQYELRNINNAIFSDY